MILTINGDFSAGTKFLFIIQMTVGIRKETTWKTQT